MAVFIPDKKLVVCETTHWRVNQRANSALPGYLMIGAIEEDAIDFSELSPEALSEMGPIIASVTTALQNLFQPDQIHVGRFGHDPGHTVHFHVVPIYRWVKEAYTRALREGGREIQYPDFMDGDTLGLFVSHEFRAEATRSEVVGPSVEHVIKVLRRELGHSCGCKASSSQQEL